MFTNNNTRFAVLASIVLAVLIAAQDIIMAVLTAVNSISAVSIIIVLAIVRWRDDIMALVFNEDEEEEEEDWTV